MKKVLLILVVFAMLFAIPTQVAARGGYHGGGPAVPCIFAGLGFLLGAAASQPPVAVVPAQCLRIVPEHWEQHWDPARGAYVQMFVPEQRIPVPCR